MHQPDILMQQKDYLGTSRGVVKGAAFASASSLFSEAAALAKNLVYIVLPCWQICLSMPDEAYLFHKQLRIFSAA